MAGVMKTFYIDGDKTDYIFWVDETFEQDMAFYEVDYGEKTKMMYSGPPGAHKEVVAEAIQRLVDRGHFPESILEMPLKTLEQT